MGSSVTPRNRATRARTRYSRSDSAATCFTMAATKKLVGKRVPLPLQRLFHGGGFGNVAPAFRHRNYRVYITGNSISLIGWWLQKVAVGWLAWTLTHSGAWLGLVSLADFLPVLVLSPFAGVLADRRDRVSIIRWTQLCGCAQATLLAILVASGAIGIHLLFGLVLALA